MQRLLEIMRTLRGPGGCPWDQEQTHESLRPYLLEEAAEAADALHTGDAGEMADELGDVLLQVAFHAVIAEEAETFSYADVETSIVEKLVRRHPHVFGEVEVKDADEVFTNWQAIKATEKGKKKSSPADSVPRSLPALMRAHELGKKLEWSQPGKGGVLEAVSKAEETSTGVGEMLLAVVDYARGHGVNPELALRDAVQARAEKLEATS